jgi:uncharacterized membrane protein
MTTNEPPPYPGQEPTPSGSDLPTYGSTPPPQDGSYTPPPPEGSYPPPPPGGYQPPIGGGDAFSPTAAIAYGWKKFRENTGPIILAALILIVISIVLSLIGGAISGEGLGDTDRDSAFDFSLSGAIANIVTSLVGYVISAGITRGALDITEGRKFDLASAFGRLDYAKVILAGLLVSILTVIGFILLILPGVIFVFLSYFTVYYVVDKGTSPVQAILDSCRLVIGNLGNALLLALLSFLVIVLGFIALCVGLLVAWPVVLIASAYAYKRFNGEPVAP